VAISTRMYCSRTFFLGFFVSLTNVPWTMWPSFPLATFNKTRRENRKVSCEGTSHPEPNVQHHSKGSSVMAQPCEERNAAFVPRSNTAVGTCHSEISQKHLVHGNISIKDERIAEKKTSGDKTFRDASSL
jgi:hypothetical protein